MFENALADPDALLAVTSARTNSFASADVSVYVLAVAPVMNAALVVNAESSARCHL